MRLPAALQHEKWLAAGLLLLFALAACTALRADSSVADEHPHILSGYLYWKSGRFAGGIDNPPLGQLLVAAPLVVLRHAYRFPADDDLWLCRLPVLLAGLGLGFVVWRWGRALGGRATGLWALLGFALTPELLAHAHVATLDVPLTLCWWLALWCWRGWLQGEGAAHRWGYGLGFAIAVAAATLTKFTGCLLLPAAWLVAVCTARNLRAQRDAILMLGFALAVLWLLAWPVYGFGAGWHGMPAALHAALAGKAAHRQEVEFAYLAGRRSTNGFLSYYVVALLLKTPLPLLALAALGSVTLVRRRARRDFLLLTVPAAGVVLAFSLLRVNIGVRHVLPVTPALVLLAAVGLAALGRRGRHLHIVRVLLLAVWAVGVVRVHPQYLAYFNVLAGGPAGGSHWLLDSNLAWGQDDARLQRYVEAATQRGEHWSVDADTRVPHTGRFAIDVNTLHDLQRRSDRPHAWLRHFAPVGFAAWSWPLFHLEEADFERAARAHPDSPVAQAAHAEVLAARGDTAAARAVVARTAARLRGAPLAELARLAAESAARRSDWQAALRWAQRGLAAQPNDADLPGLAHWAELELRLQEATSTGAPSGRAALELGLFRAESGRVREALPALQRAAAALQDTADARRIAAVALVRLGEYEPALRLLNASPLSDLQAERDLCRALRSTQAGLDRGQDDIDVQLLRELGRTCFENERFDDALAAFLAILRQQPDNAEALAFAAEIQVRCKLRLVHASLHSRPIVVLAAARAR